jgi:hypothetical protein
MSRLAVGAQYFPYNAEALQSRFGRKGWVRTGQTPPPALVAVASTEGPLKHPLCTSPDSPKSKRAFCYANRCLISQQNALGHVQEGAVPAVYGAKPATGGGHPTPHTEKGKKGAGGGNRIELRGHNHQRNANLGRQSMRTAHMDRCGSRSTCNKTSPIKSPASQQNTMICTKSRGFNITPFQALLGALLPLQNTESAQQNTKPAQ